MTGWPVAQAEEYLAHVDPVLGAVITAQSITEPKPRGDYFASLVRTIVGQQISVASAKATIGRLRDATNLDPAAIQALTDDQAKSLGLSRQKAGYIRDLSTHFIRDPDIYTHLEQRTDTQVITELTAVKGLGVWSAQMFLIFTLGRPDVFAPGDIGVQNAMIRIYGLPKPPPLDDLLRISDPWRPYRSIALLHLWQSLSNEPLIIDS